MACLSEDGAVIDAQASRISPRRVLRVAAGANVVLYNLTLTGAWTLQGSDPGGGAVSNEGFLSMYSCVVRDSVGSIGMQASHALVRISLTPADVLLHGLVALLPVRPHVQPRPIAGFPASPGGRPGSRST